MALYTKTGSTIPEDAVRLSEDDAVKFMRNIVTSWKDSSDVKYLQWTPGILGGLTALTSVYANNYYRSRLRLQSFGRVSTYLPIVAIPAFASFFVHHVKVQSAVLIEKYQCPICTQMKATFYQAATGILYPFTMSPLLGFMMASRYYTYNVPPAQKDPKGVWRLYVKLTKPMATTFGLVAAVHFLITNFLTYEQILEVATVNRKLMEIEDEVDQSKNHK